MTNSPPENARGTRKTRALAPEETPTSKASSQPEQQQQQQQQPAQPSLASRVQSSAAGLARSAFQGGASDVAQTLASATDEKTAGSGSGSLSAQTGQGYLSTRETSTSSTAPGSAAGYAVPAGGETFREGWTSSAPQGGFALPEMTEEEFQRGDAYTDNEAMMSGAALGREDGHQRPELDSLQAETGTWKGKQRAHDPMQLEYNTAWERAEQMPQQTSPVQALPSDGAAVVSLLSDASFDPNFDPGADQLDLDPAASPPPLTASEIETLESFRRSIGLSDTGREYSSQQQLSGLSLVPDIDTFLQQNDPEGYSPTQAHIPGNVNTSSNSATTLRDNVLANLPGAADWVSVQERYHDEVWGYLRPALEAAKAEMEDTGGSGMEQGEDGPAVRRLKMILKHMKA